MTRASVVPLLADARSGRYAIGAFNVITLEGAEAIVAGAERVSAAVILQISQNTVAYHGALGPLGGACCELAARARYPVSVHLDHATTVDLCDEAVALGFDSVMFDASSAPFEENAARTLAVALRIHAAGLAVEAELGVVGGKAGGLAAGPMTDPDLAARFVELTGVDALAVAVGTSHHRTTPDARPDVRRIAELRETVSTPLVLHGSSSVDDASLAAAVHAGIAKVNLSTQLNQAFSAAVRAAVAPGTHDPRVYLGAGREAMTTAVAEKIVLIGSAGRATRRT